MTKIYYALSYSYQDDFGNHYFQIGYFSSEKKVLDAIEILKGKPGFKNYTDGFDYQKIEIEFDNHFVYDNEIILYELSYEKHNNDGTDSFVIFDVYPSYECAYQSQLKISQANRFTDSFDEICIAEKKLDRIEWAEGFESW